MNPPTLVYEELEKKIHFKTFLLVPIQNSKISEYLLQIRIYSTKKCALYYTLKHANGCLEHMNMSNEWVSISVQRGPDIIKKMHQAISSARNDRRLLSTSCK